MPGWDDQEDTNSDEEVARRERVRRIAFGTAAAVGLGLGAAGLARALRERGGLSRSANPLEYQHFVRGHDRKLSTGRVVPVRPHIRGPRGAAIKTTAYIEPDQLHSLVRMSEGVRLAIPEQILAAA